MARSSGTAWGLVKQSWAILRQDQEPVGLTFIAGTASAMVAMALVVGGSLLWDAFESAAIMLAYTVIAYMVMSVVAMFFNAAMIAVVLMRFGGEDPSLRDGLRIAWRRAGPIAIFGIIAGTVGVLLDGIFAAINRNDRWIAVLIGSIFVGTIALAWGNFSFLAVPILIVEKVSAPEAIQRSKRLVKQTWGAELDETVRVGAVGRLAFAAVTIVLAIPGMVLAMSGYTRAGGVLLGVGFVAIVAIATLAITLSGIYRSALYLHATGNPVKGIDLEYLTFAFVRRPPYRGFWYRLRHG